MWPTDVLGKVCDYAGPLDLERLAQTCQTWRKAAFSSSFWSVLDKDRFALFFNSDCTWSNRRDRAWKLDEEDRSNRTTPLLYRNGVKLRLWESPLERLWSLLETGRLARLRDVDFSFFADTPGFTSSAAVRRVVEAAPNLECVRVGADTDAILPEECFFEWLQVQLDGVTRYHRNPESLRVFCLTAWHEFDSRDDRQNEWTRVNETLLPRVVAAFRRVERACFRFDFFQERIWSADVLLDAMRTGWTGLTHLHWEFTNIPGDEEAYQRALRALFDATALRSLALFFFMADDLHVPLLDALPTSLIDLEIGPFESTRGWPRFRDCLRERLHSLRFLHVACVNERSDEAPRAESYFGDRDVERCYTDYDLRQLRGVAQDRPDIELTFDHMTCGTRDYDYS